jgi:uncharacterized protein (DUF433 family)
MPTPKQTEIPVQPVNKPIVCSPFKEPTAHWVYNTQTGQASRMSGRRPASYWFKTERTGSAQMQLGIVAEEEREDLPLVNALKGSVDEVRFAALIGTVSLPFPAGKHQRAAVKAIDPPGNEVMRVHRLNGKTKYDRSGADMTRAQLLERIGSDPARCGGKPCIRRHRLRVSLILDMLAGGSTQAEMLEDYPALTEGDILACSACGSEMARERYVTVPLEPA